MGIVYKAEDSKLQRTVAIKFLPRQIAATEEQRKRFKIEARAAAALNHPNIATIYAIEETSGEMFIVMEYIQGKELKEIIAANMPQVQNLREVLGYASQIAEGLQAAHEKGVVHRDIKSSNIMITDKGQVKVMDFGLAKVQGSAQLTQEGMTLGTVAYMSPEQTQGNKVDHRTDIWAFGVVLYEMLAGDQPFKGDYEQAIFYSILSEEPQNVSDLNPSVPTELIDVVAKALQKELADRYQNMGELLTDHADILFFTLECKNRSSGNHPPPIDFCQRIDKLFGDPIAKIFLVLLRTQVGKRQHSNCKVLVFLSSRF